MIHCYIWLLLTTTLLSIPNDLFCDNDLLYKTPHNTMIHRGTHLTFRRYYFISRLDKTMRLLLKIQSTHRMSFSRNLRAISFDISMFHNKRIIRSLRRIEELRNLKPLFMIWDDFVAYKSLEDDVFIEDFSKEIFVVTRTVLSSLNEENIDIDTHWLQEFTHTLPNKTEHLLDAIDEITHALQKIVPQNPEQEKRTLETYPLDLKSEVSTDEIALRFYYIQRLHTAMDIISKNQPGNQYLTLQWIANWRSDRVTSLLRAMQESGKPTAILNAWDEVKEYKFIDNIRFIKEFISVVFIALRHLYTGPDASGILGNTHTDLENMDIENVLHAIDIITDQLAATPQVYNGYTAESFQDWLYHYWWVAPATIGTIALRLAYYYYTHHKPFGNYGYGPSFGYHYGQSSSSINYASPITPGVSDSLSFDELKI